MNSELREFISGLEVEDLPPAPFKIYLGPGHNGQDCHFTVVRPATYVYALKEEMSRVDRLCPNRLGAYTDEVARLKTFLEEQVKQEEPEQNMFAV